MKRIKYILLIALILVNAINFTGKTFASFGGGGTGGSEGVLNIIDNQQRFEFISRIPDTDRFFRMVTLGWFIDITKPNGSSVKTFVEGGTDGDNDELYKWTFDSKN